MRRALVLFLLLCLPASARAMWALVPLDVLVQGSDLIVVGTLRDVAEHTADGVDYGQGRVVVREVIWGGVSPGDSLTLRWQNASSVGCPRVEHRHSQGEEGIWLFTRDGGAVRADYPGRFVGLDRRGEVEAALAASPVVLRTEKYLVGREDPLVFTVVYRNVTRQPRDFPGVSGETGRPLFTSGSKLEVKADRDGAEWRVRLAGPFALKQALAPVTVGPRSELRFDVALRPLLDRRPAEGDSFDVTLKLPGLPRTNSAEFYVDRRELPRPEPPPLPGPTPVGDFVYVFKAPAEDLLRPHTRAALVLLGAALLFPFFYKLRSRLAWARLARVLQGTQTWQI